jgi:hypothetical protein
MQFGTFSSEPFFLQNRSILPIRPRAQCAEADIKLAERVTPIQT